MNKYVDFVSDKDFLECVKYVVDFYLSDEYKEEPIVVLKESKNVESFSYKHERGASYETFSIRIGEVKLVVAATIEVTSGYMVTIRNASQEQQRKT